MNLCDRKLQELQIAVENVNPQLADYWQATAIIESLGYTDRVIQGEFNFPNALALGKYIYERHCPLQTQKTSPPQQHFWQKALKELEIFIEQFSRSFVYAIPLILMFFLEYIGLNDGGRSLPPALASLITLATLASLCTSGGFVQMISRRGAFYVSLGEPIQARRVCILIFYLGTATSIVLCLIGLWFGFYRSLVSDEYLIIGAIYYLLLSLLWLLIAILSVLFAKAEVLILIGFSLLFLLFRVYLRIGAIESQILTTSITLVLAIILVAISYRQKNTESDDSHQVNLPRLSALVHLLAPYFFYGIGYFSFIFADRIVAGWTVDPASGLIFSINSDYQQQMNLALLNFLFLVPWVEYLSYKFIRYWYDRVKKLTPKKISAFSKQLQYRYGLLVISIIVFFALSVMLTLSKIQFFNWQTLFGCLGYLLFAIGLLNGILLFSLNRATTVLKTLLPSLALNFTIGYLLANLVDVRWAAAGLILGGFAFMILSTYQVIRTIKKPDYAYFLSGY